ncbi:MAG: hemolysin family protein [Armatimonadota bacterium]|nr:hemolysin family protein [Armatimonadota bacterium]MDR7439776.1 hemolysin family protein [Armatimonadota bacterium]MDR7562263.1 hemolysin family protein [Armatimonadota bacterium]MDR7568322.1 hemolysin family protein [Armatimonadota bacterium]
MDDSGSWVLYVLLGVLVLLSIFFSLAEVALLSASSKRLRELAEGKGSLRASIALRLLEHPSRLAGSLVVGGTMARLAAAVVATRMAIEGLGFGRGEVVAFLGITVGILLATEVLPRAIGARHREACALWCAVPAYLWTTLLAPVGSLLARLPLDRTGVTQEELRMLVEAGEANGALEAGEREMISSIFEFRETIVREIMVPRVDIRAVPARAKLMEIVDLLLQEGHSRYPVYRETIDQVVGVVYVKDLFRYIREGRTEITAEEIMRPAYFVPETKKVDELFREMRQNHIHLAIVVDEYGGTAGLVTIEDVLEEIVGEIRDEYDVEELPPLVRVDESTALVDARMLLEDVNEALGLTLPTDEVDTVGGLVYSRLGHVPAQGEEITVNGVVIRVEELAGHRIARVRIQRITPQAAPSRT